MILNNSLVLRPVNCYDCEQCFLSGILDGNISLRSGQSYTGFFYSLSILGQYPVRIFAQCCTTVLTTKCNRWCGTILRNKAVHCFMEKLPPTVNCKTTNILFTCETLKSKCERSTSNCDLEALVLEEIGKLEYPQNNLSEEGENQQQTQSTYLTLDIAVNTNTFLKKLHQRSLDI